MESNYKVWGFCPILNILTVAASNQTLVSVTARIGITMLPGVNPKNIVIVTSPVIKGSTRAIGYCRARCPVATPKTSALNISKLGI